MLATLFAREASLLIDSELFRPYEIASHLWEGHVPFWLPSTGGKFDFEEFRGWALVFSVCPVFSSLRPFCLVLWCSACALSCLWDLEMLSLTSLSFLPASGFRHQVHGIASFASAQSGFFWYASV